MSTIVRGKQIPLECVMKNLLFLLLKITELEEWDKDGNKTGKIVGYSYECVDCMNFDKFKFKIKGQRVPLMTNEELQEQRESGMKVMVEFLEPTVLVYWSNATKTYEDSFSAKGVSLFENIE
ncbi:hypothetical protein H6A64_13310 [Lacrimispora saccharolytica]|nr:hypothetical protein [Lacrimispora saccharolytica]